MSNSNRTNSQKTKLSPSFFEQSVDAIVEKTAQPNNIYNTPIGDGAVLKPAGIKPSMGLTTSTIPIILQPHEDTIPIYRAKHAWGPGARKPGGRHEHTGEVVGRLPVDDSFALPHGNNVPNNSAVYLDKDGRTLKSVQPLHIPKGGTFGTARYAGFPEGDLLGDRTYGSHGGSTLSSLDSAIKLGELVPGGEINHTLSISLWGDKNYYYNKNDPNPGYRWPARRADAYAAERYGGTNPELQMGALLALPKDFDLNSLQTEPAKIMAEALMNYGGYVMDDTAWDVHVVTTETSPNGNVKDEFKEAWGFKMNERGKNHPWTKDINKIFTSLNVVTNNGPDAVGGGGDRPSLAELRGCRPSVP